MSDFNNENFEADGASFRHMNPARIAYIKPTGLEEARKQGIIPEGIQLPEGTRLYVLHAVDGRGRRTDGERDVVPAGGRVDLAVLIDDARTQPLEDPAQRYVDAARLLDRRLIEVHSAAVDDDRHVSALLRERRYRPTRCEDRACCACAQEKYITHGWGLPSHA